MESNPRFCAAVVEFDIQRCHVSLKGQPRGALIRAESIIDCVILISHCELVADFEIFILWKILWSPGCKAIGIPVIASLGPILGSIEITMEVPG